MQRELTLKFTSKAPKEPGQYICYFPGTNTYDAVNLQQRRSPINDGFYLAACGRGGNIEAWRCEWSQKLA